MVSWSAVEQAEPEFAAKVRSAFDVRKHKTIATLRADGAPRISGIEAEFADGELTFGSRLRCAQCSVACPVGSVPGSARSGSVRPPCCTRR